MNGSIFAPHCYVFMHCSNWNCFHSCGPHMNYRSWVTYAAACLCIVEHFYTEYTKTKCSDIFWYYNHLLSAYPRSGKTHNHLTMRALKWTHHFNWGAVMIMPGYDIGFGCVRSIQSGMKKKHLSRAPVEKHSWRRLIFNIIGRHEAKKKKKK